MVVKLCEGPSECIQSQLLVLVETVNISTLLSTPLSGDVPTLSLAGGTAGALITVVTLIDSPIAPGVLVPGRVALETAS